MDEQKRSLREFLRHVNDYTYRFDPEKGQFRYRELRGVRDTAFDFYMWLKCWKDMIVFVAKCPVSAVRALFRYQWFSTYLTYPNFVDRGTLGMRGNQLRMARAQYDRIVKKATDLLRISFVADEHFHPGNKLSKKIVLFDELVPGQIMAGFPNLIYLPAQVLPVFLCSILNQQITPPYLDAAENFGIPADVCPLPSAEAGCALRDEYPKLGTCFVACNMPCDGSVATTAYQDRYFNLPTYYYGVPIRYNEDAVQDYAVGELRRLIRRAVERGVYLSMGYSERDAVSGTLYNSNVMIAPDGTAMNHRKLKPTGSERVVWGDADRDYFPVMDTPWGPMGNLICWESYMPLARVALYQKGISLYISPNTNDNPEWQDTIRHIAIEGHCYFINADLVFRRSDYPQTVSGTAEIAALPDIACRGGSCVIDPFGHEASVTVWDKEDIIYADLDMQKVPASRMELDCVGHYARPDVLELRVNEK